MKKINVLKKSSDFDKIIAKGHFIKNKEFVIYYDNGNDIIYHVGISVGKKIGNAVIRNYYKRIVRNILDINKNILKNDMNYIVIVRKNCTFLSYNDICSSLINLLKKI